MMFKIKNKLITSIAPIFILLIGCEDSTPQAGISYRIEATSLTIEPSLSKKSTATTPDVTGNTVFENEEGYYGTDSTEAGEYTFTITARCCYGDPDSLIRDTTVTKTLTMEEGGSYGILASPHVDDYSWSVSEY